MQAGAAARLTLPAEVLWLAIGPADGGLLANRRRLRRALALASESEGGPRSGRRAWRSARAELVAAGLIEDQRRPRLTERKPAAARFREIEAVMGDAGAAAERDRELFMLLAGSGVLATRLTREGRKKARRTLASLVPEPNDANMTLRAGGLALFSGAGFGELAAGGGSDFGGGGIEGIGAGVDASTGADGGGGDGGGGQ